MNASNIKYRNRLKRRVDISRQQQQLSQQSLSQQPFSSNVVLPLQSSDDLNDHCAIENEKDVSLNERGIIDVQKGGRDTAAYNGHESRRGDEGKKEGNGIDRNHNSYGAINPASNNCAMGSNIDSMGSNESEALKQRAKDIIFKRSQRNTNAVNSPMASSPPTGLPADNQNNGKSEELHDRQAMPPKRNSNSVTAMINRYENRGAVGPSSQQQSIRPSSFHPQHSYTNNNSTKITPPSKSVISPPTTTTHHPYQSSPPSSTRDEFSTTTSVLTDEAMDDRTSMIRNVTQWERRMQLQRQLLSKEVESNALSSRGVGSKPSLTNDDGEVLDLVSEAIAINEGRTSSIRSLKPSSNSSKVTTDNVSSTSSTTPIQHSTTAKVVTPDDKRKHPPQPPSSSDDKELPPSPAQTDHSADAAAGMMFALQQHGENSTRKMITNLVKSDKRKVMSSLRQGANSGVASLTKNGRVSSISPSSKLGSTKSTTPTFQSRSYPSRQLGLEQKLGRLTKSQLAAASSNMSVNDTSRMSVATSIVSAQPSVESECVRQNAEIMLAMEGEMMDFLVGGGAAANDSDGGMNEESDVHNNNANNNDGDFNDNRLPQQMDNTFSTLFSVDERDENSDYADPPLMSDSDIDSNSRSDNSYDSGYDSYEQSIRNEYMTMKQKQSSMVRRRKDKDLGTFFDQLSSFLGVRCAVDMDEDSDVFYMNNSQFNTSFSVDDFQQWQDYNDDGITAGSNTQKRAPSKHSSDSSCTESHTTMVVDNTARQRDHLAYLTPTMDSGPAFQFARHDASGDEEVDVNDGSLPDPEEESGFKYDHSSSGRDPPRGIDPEEGEEVLHRNRFHQQNSPNANNAELNPDHVKLSTRERLKGSSLHWQSSNGIILDETTNATQQLSPVRKSEKATSVSDLPPFSANTTLLKEHFVESEKLSPNYRRGAGGLQYIDEVEDEDESELSVEDESEGPQYKYDQFVKDFQDVVPKDSAVNESEPVEELVIGSISEGEAVESSARTNFKLSNVTQRREIEAALHRSMRQANFNRQRKFVVQNPKPEMMSSQLEGGKQQLPTTQAQNQSGRKEAGIRPSPQNTHAPNPQPNVGAKTRLEQKLQGLGAPAKLSGDSVGTSELGSLYSASVVSKTVVNRTNLPPTKSIPLTSLGATPISTEKLNKDFFDSSPLNPQPRSNKLGFFPPSIDETSQLSDGFGPLKSNKFNHQSQLERMEQSSPIPPPAVNRYRQRIPLNPPQPMRNYPNNGHPTKKLIMKNPTEMRGGTRVQTQTLRLVSRGGPSPQSRSPPSVPSGKRFQAFPSTAKVVRSSPQPQRVIPVAKRMNQPLRKQASGYDDRRHIQGAHNAPRHAHVNNSAPSRGAMNKSLEDKLRSMDPPTSEPSFSEASQVSSSVFEAVEVGSFGVQHTLTSKWDKPKDAQPYRGVSYISTYKGKEEQDQALNRGGKLKHKMMAMTTKASPKHKLSVSPLGRMKTKK